MINLFNIQKPIIDFRKFDHVLHGSIVSDLEQEFASYVGTDYACGVNSCTNAITLALEWVATHIAANLQPTVPTMAPPVILNAIHHAGFQTTLLDIPTWMGHEYKLLSHEGFDIYDSAQAVMPGRFTARHNENFCALYSFYPTKPVGGIDGGMVATNNETLWKWLKIATMNGTTANPNSWERNILFTGWKAYLSSAQAYVAMTSLHALDERKEKLAWIRSIYNEQFGYPHVSDHLYVIDVQDNRQTMIELKKSGIATGIHYPCLNLMGPYRNTTVYPRSEERSKHVLSIPFHDSLTKEEVDYVCREVKRYC